MLDFDITTQTLIRLNENQYGDGQLLRRNKMKKLLISLALLVVSITAYAACTTHTYSSGTRIVTCTTCCDANGNCNTNCF